MTAAGVAALFPRDRRAVLCTGDGGLTEGRSFPLDQRGRPARCGLLLPFECSGGVLVGPDHGAVDRDGPVGVAVSVRGREGSGEDLLTGLVDKRTKLLPYRLVSVGNPSARSFICGYLLRLARRLPPLPSGSLVCDLHVRQVGTRSVKGRFLECGPVGEAVAGPAAAQDRLYADCLGPLRRGHGDKP